MFWNLKKFDMPEGSTNWEGRYVYHGPFWGYLPTATVVGQPLKPTPTAAEREAELEATRDLRETMTVKLKPKTLDRLGWKIIKYEHKNTTL